MKYDSLSLEELLLMARNGDELALETLLKIVEKNKFTYARLAAPETYYQLDEWDLREASFHSSVEAVTHYEFGKKTRFLTYFLKIYKHALYGAIAAKIKQKKTFVCSADDYVAPDRSHAVLCDIIPSQNFSDDPQAFVNYADTLRTLNDLPENIPPTAVKIADLVMKGYSLEETTKFTGLTLHQTKYQLRKLRKWAAKTLGPTHGKKPVEKQAQEKEKDFDSSLNLENEDKDE